MVIFLISSHSFTFFLFLWDFVSIQTPLGSQVRAAMDRAARSRARSEGAKQELAKDVLRERLLREEDARRTRLKEAPSRLWRFCVVNRLVIFMS